MLDDAFENQLQATYIKQMQKQAMWERNDRDMQNKFDFMYNMADWENDRTNIRNKYLLEMNKKTSLQDIGEMLDDMILDSKAKNYKHYNLGEHYNLQSKRASKDYTSNDFKWSGRIMKLIDPKTPYFFQDESLLN